jgi:hypothetical protein
MAWGFLPNKPGALHPDASSTLKHGRAFIFSAYGRKLKPPVSRVAVDLLETVYYHAKLNEGKTE